MKDENKIPKLTPIGKIMRITGVARFYRDGNGARFIWRWWHPLSWILAPLFVVVSVVLDGIFDTWRYRHDIGIGMKPWFKERPAELRWF